MTPSPIVIQAERHLAIIPPLGQCPGIDRHQHRDRACGSLCRRQVGAHRPFRVRPALFLTIWPFLASFCQRVHPLPRCLHHRRRARRQGPSGRAHAQPCLIHRRRPTRCPWTRVVEPDRIRDRTPARWRRNRHPPQRLCRRHRTAPAELQQVVPGTVVAVLPSDDLVFSGARNREPEDQGPESKPNEIVVVGELRSVRSQDLQHGIKRIVRAEESHIDRVACLQGNQEGVDLARNTDRPHHRVAQLNNHAQRYGHSQR